jgi:hypothetical protein
MPRELTHDYLLDLRRRLAERLPKYIVDDIIARARGHAGGKAPRKKKPGGTEETEETTTPQEGEANGTDQRGESDGGAGAAGTGETGTGG